MSSLDDIRNERLKKLEILKEKGVDPFPADSQKTHSVKEVTSNFDALLKEGADITISGRVRSLRRHGGSVFFDIDDGTGKIQGYLKEDGLDGDSFGLFNDTIDVGDFIEISGKAFVTKKGQNTVLGSSWRILAKTLRPIPEEWFGLKDTEERLRKRYLDILLNSEVKEMMERKAKFWDVMREFLKERGFLEVETPTLEFTTGGAEANPFKTHHRDFDMDVYLRISVGELWQKRLMAAGLPKTFEIGRVYRNEGSSLEHLQEFTNMEFYSAYTNFEEGKQMVRDLYIALAKEVFGKTQFETKGHSFDLSGEWKDVDYVSTVKEMTGIDVLEASEEEMEKKLSELGVEYAGKNKERMTDSLWKHCRKKISGPAFLVNHPKLVAPLSKTHPENPKLTKTFQVILAGSEVGRAHAELNDPLEQEERFESQQKLLEKGDTEAMMADHEFVEMLEYGMPPTFGFGVGDRLFSFMIDKPLRETQIFPLMKPRHNTNTRMDTNDTNGEG